MYQKALQFVERLRHTKTDRNGGSEDHSQGHNKGKPGEDLLPPCHTRTVYLECIPNCPYFFLSLVYNSNCLTGSSDSPSVSHLPDQYVTARGYSNPLRCSEK